MEYETGQADASPNACPRGPSIVMTNCFDVCARQDGVPGEGGTVRGCRRHRRGYHQQI